jgi:subtilisin family serine protease
MNHRFSSLRPFWARRISSLVTLIVAVSGSSFAIAQVPLEDYLQHPQNYDVNQPTQKDQVNSGTFFNVAPNWEPSINLKYAFTPNDPYFAINQPNAGLPGQWHLRNNTSVSPPTDANLLGAWNRNLTGQGVTIGIVDDGLEHLHPDLSPNYVATDSRNFGTTGPPTDPSPVWGPIPLINYAGDNHGTAVAGVAAAFGGNTTGGTGAAPMAGLAGLRIDFPFQTDAMFVAATGYHSNGVGAAGSNIKIKNHSYGISVPFIPTVNQTSALVASHNNGTIHVFAAGNERAIHGGVLDLNQNGFFDLDFDYAIDSDANKKHNQSIQETIAVAAIGNDGKFSFYSNFGANVFVTAPSSDFPGFGILTTDRMGATGYNSVAGGADGDSMSDLNYTSTFGGTSSASPLVAGIMALGKQANPVLNTRMAKHLMIKTNVKVDPGDGSITGGGNGVAGSAWITNIAGNSFNQNYGFGMIDADAFTLAATQYSGVTPLVIQTTGTIPVNLAIPDGGSISRTFTLTGTGALEEVEVTLDIDHNYRGDLEAMLMSPSGTKNRLMISNPADSFNRINWTLVTNAFWGENPFGPWTLTVSDRAMTDTGMWNNFSVLAKTGNLIAVPEPTSIGLAFCGAVVLLRRGRRANKARLSPTRTASGRNCRGGGASCGG